MLQISHINFETDQRQLVFIFPGWHIAVPTYLLEKKKIVLFFPRAEKKKQDRFSEFFPFFFFSTIGFFFSQKIMGTYLQKNLVGFFFPTYQAGKKKPDLPTSFTEKRPKYDLPPRKKNQLPFVKPSD